MLHVGQKVIHVPIYGKWEKFEREHPGQPHPIKEQIYTIREVYQDDPNWGVRLHEILGQIHPELNVECGWGMEEFKPIVERKTDISIFLKILDDVSKGILDEIRVD